MTDQHTGRVGRDTGGKGLFVLGNRYVVEREVAQGGMGVVYAGRDTLLDRPVAVKVMTGGPGREPQDEFLREARAAAALKHARIVDIYDAGVERDLRYIVMEYVAGETLRELIAREAPLDPARAAPIVAEIAEALDYAHRRGIVHCDIKPGNILLPADDRPKIVDFGIAHAGHGPGGSAGDAIVGTAAYISPEQIEGTALDGRADVYSLSAVLYEMLTGAPPYQGRDLAAVVAERDAHPPAPPRLRNARVPEGLSDTVMRGLQPRPEERFASAAAFAAALRGFSEDATRYVTRPIADRPPVDGAGTDTEVWSRRPASAEPLPRARRRVPWAAVAVLGALAAVAVAAGVLLAAGIVGGSDGTVTVPDVVNSSVLEAAQQLHELELKTPTELVASQQPVGTVLEQDPRPGTVVKRSSIVRLTISQGP